MALCEFTTLQLLSFKKKIILFKRYLLFFSGHLCLSLGAYMYECYYPWKPEALALLELGFQIMGCLIRMLGDGIQVLHKSKTTT